jgi:POT family proton-dependent oligopeptide transporter
VTKTVSDSAVQPFMGLALFANHPAGLPTLFFTEMWERFSYYGMRALLVLYMAAPVSAGGLAFSPQQVGDIYGTYTMMVYMASIPGGFIADNILGAKLSVLIGGAIIALGHFTLANPALPAFYTGLCLIVLGTGLLKPNISTMLGGLYGPNDHRRDSGFSIFYMGINIGAALAPIICGFLAQSKEFKSYLSSMHLNPLLSWHWGFAAAGVGMVFGLIQFVLQREKLKDVGNLSRKKDAPVTQKAEPEATVGVSTSGNLTIDEWKRLGAVAILFFFHMAFWTVYEQGGSSLNLFADRLTNCEMFGWQFPSSWFQSLPAIFVIIAAPLFSALWVKMGDKEPSSPTKFAYGLAFLGLGIFVMVPATMMAAQYGKVGVMWLVGCYLLQVIGEMCLSPVGLSTATKLAPRRFVASTMGIWFLSMAFGNKLAGYLGGMFNAKDLHGLMILFAGMAGGLAVCVVLLALLVPTIRKLMVGVH